MARLASHPFATHTAEEQGKAGKARGAAATGWQAHGVRESETRGDQHTKLQCAGSFLTTSTSSATPAHFMETEGSYPSSQETTIYPCPESDESGPRPPS